ncbi:hypothetical protein ACN9J6_09760 [Aliarcobacter butzleri]|uniref:hypothetical protein n=1 Tax=Aliarcobacter butzleri TaxID=28197 RepID=UPI003B21164C
MKIKDLYISLLLNIVLFLTVFILFPEVNYTNNHFILQFIYIGAVLSPFSIVVCLYFIFQYHYKKQN